MPAHPPPRFPTSPPYDPARLVCEAVDALAPRAPVLASLLGAAVDRLERSSWQVNVVGVDQLVRQPLEQLAVGDDLDSRSAAAACDALERFDGSLNGLGALLTLCRAAQAALDQDPALASNPTSNPTSKLTEQQPVPCC